MYSISKSDCGEWYCIEKESKPLLTTMGHPVRTAFKSLADKLLTDLEKYGEDPSDPVSIVAFHYAMIDFFYNM